MGKEPGHSWGEVYIYFLNIIFMYILYIHTHILYILQCLPCVYETMADVALFSGEVGIV